MGDIPAPKPNSPDNFIDCQQALESRVQDIIAEAYAAGWNHGEAIAAIIEICENLALGLGENDALDKLLGRLRRE